MADGAPVQDHASLIVRDMRQQAQASGKMNPKMDQFLNEFEITLRQRLSQSEDQGKAMRELFTHRKDLAKKLTDNILAIGDRASQHELDLYRSAEQFKLDAAKQAAGLNLENQSIIESKKAGWSGFWQIAANLFKGIGVHGIADWCQKQADLNAPKVLSANTGQLQDLKGRVAINPESPVGRAMSVFTTALHPTNPDVARVGAEAGAEAQRQLDAARQANSDKPPAHVPNLPGSPVPVPAGSAAPTAYSAGSVETMTKQLLSRIASESKLSQDVIDKLTRDVVGIDSAKTGSRSGKIDTEAEAKAFRDRPAYKGLNPDQQRAVGRALGLPEPAPQ